MRSSKHYCFLSLSPTTIPQLIPVKTGWKGQGLEWCDFQPILCFVALHFQPLSVEMKLTTEHLCKALEIQHVHVLECAVRQASSDSSRAWVPVQNLSTINGSIIPPPFFPSP